MRFSPTTEQLEAATDVFIANAFFNLVEADFKKFTCDILATGQYQYHNDYRTGLLKQIFHVPDDGILINPDHFAMMQVMPPFNNPSGYTKGTTAADFYAALNHIAIQEGYHEGQLAATFALQSLQKTEERFMQLTLNIHNAPNYASLPYDTKEQLLNTVLNYFHVNNMDNNFMAKEKNYFDRYRQQPASTSNHDYDASTFAEQKFLSYKRCIPTLDFLTGLNLPAATTKFQNVAAVYCYLPGYYIMEMKPADQWVAMRVPFTASRFAYESIISGILFKNDRIEILERKLFNEFIQSPNR